MSILFVPAIQLIEHRGDIRRAQEEVLQAGRFAQGRHALSDRLQGVFRSLRGRGALTPEDVDQALREIRLAMLEADVHFKVVKQFLERVRVRAVGQDVLKSLTPDQAVLRVVRDEMVALFGGGDEARLQGSSKLPAVILMTGLQGSGKTTSTAKLARWLLQGGHHPLPLRHERAVRRIGNAGGTIWSTPAPSQRHDGTRLQ